MKTAQWYEGFGAGFNRANCPRGVNADYQSGWLEGGARADGYDRLENRSNTVECPVCGEDVDLDD